MTIYGNLNLELYNDMLSLKDESTENFNFTLDEFTAIFRKYSGNLNVAVEANTSDDVDFNTVVITGDYDPDAEFLNEAAIVIHVNFNTEQETICFADLDWPVLCRELISTVGHEIIRRQEYRNRNYDIPAVLYGSKNSTGRKLEIKEFLGNLDEIEAFGFNIALEVFLTHGTNHAINGKKALATPVAKTYIKTFGYDHPITKMVLQSSIRYYTYLVSSEKKLGIFS